MVVAFWTFVLMRYVVFEFVSTYPVLFGVEPSRGQVEAFARLISIGGAALLLLVFVGRFGRGPRTLLWRFGPTSWRLLCLPWGSSPLVSSNR
jgi:hypothetical protein